MKWVLAAIAASAACNTTNAVECGNGIICPAGTTCKEIQNPPQTVCATSEQLGACDDKADFDECTLDGFDQARCYEGLCQEAGCGNGHEDPDEICDDGNNANADGCSADCMSKETCGNGIVDVVTTEVCDDGNNIDHDGCSSTCQPEQLHWVVQSGKGPPTRSNGVMAYDPLRDRLVLFGGAPDTSGAELGDTWQWNGADWEEYLGSGPNTRVSPAMAFDGHGVVLFGGITQSTIYDDTWVFDGQTWTPRSALLPADTDPDPVVAANKKRRYLHSMAYDSHRKRVVMYGGYDGNFAQVTDTYEWDGTTWMRVTTAHNPGFRANAAMAYDPVRDRIVLVGGTPPTGAAQTWVYNGVDWTDVTPSSGDVPEPYRSTMAFDTASGKLIAFGGCATQYCSTPSAGRTLAWDGTTWTDLAITSPPDRMDHQIASTGTRLVTLGGRDSSSGPFLEGTWIFEGGAWTEATRPSGRMMAGYAADTLHHRIVLFGGTSTGYTALGDTWELTTSGWKERTAGPQPEARYRTAMAYDPIAHKVVMYGGVGASGNLYDTWLWDGNTWTDAAPATSLPAPRVRASMAFDGHHVILFGGSSTDVGTYTWDGANWTQASPAHSPTPRLGAAAGYDPVRNELVMFGGALQQRTNNETWTYNGTDWTQKMPLVSPGARAEATLTWNPARQRLMLTGGGGAFDVWEWDGTAWTQLPTTNEPPRRDNFGSATSLAGTGTVVHGGYRAPTMFDDLWELRWDGTAAGERCTGDDDDGDMLADCTDADCWMICTPQCLPGTSCPATAPRCGDNTCDGAFESCRTCPQDCQCTPRCGDLICDPGETCPGDC